MSNITEKQSDMDFKAQIKNFLEKKYRKPNENDSFLDYDYITTSSVLSLLRESFSDYAIGYDFVESILLEFGFEVVNRRLSYSNFPKKCYVVIIKESSDTSIREVQEKLKAYFHSLEWQGEDKISKVAKSLMFLNDTEAAGFRAYFEKWLVQCLAHTLDGQPAPNCLVLVGNNGIGKSSFLERLLPYNALRTTIFNEEDVNTLLQTYISNLETCFFVYNECYFEDFPTLKKLYKNSEIFLKEGTILSIANFCGSTNQVSLLKQNIDFIDAFFVAGVDFHLLDFADIEQMWAQAMQLYKDNTHKNETIVTNSYVESLKKYAASLSKKNDELLKENADIQEAYEKVSKEYDILKKNAKTYHFGVMTDGKDAQYCIDFAALSFQDITMYATQYANPFLTMYVDCMIQIKEVAKSVNEGAITPELEISCRNLAYIADTLRAFSDVTRKITL